MNKPIMLMLREFSKQQGCEKYSADGKRIELLETYLWVRQLTPDLTFEVFLERFAPLADFDAVNLKHPADSLKHRCPRAKATATALNVPQWSAKEAVDILAIYVDNVREAENQGVEFDMPLDEHLELMGPEYKSGALEPPEDPKPARAPRAPRATTKAAVPGELGKPPTAEGQRVVYTQAGGGREIPGVVNHITEVDADGRSYVTFTSDTGEVYEGRNILHCRVIESAETVPPPPDTNGDTVLGSAKLTIAKAQWPAVQAALALDKPMGNVAVGDAIYAFSQDIDDTLAEVAVVNGQTGPYVDANLMGAEDILAGVQPRKNILGEYRFETEHGVYVLDVAARE